MNYFCKHYVTHDSAVQTDFDGAHNIALSLGSLYWSKLFILFRILIVDFFLDLKLKNVDKQFNEISSNFSNKLSFEEKVVAYQKKLDEEYKKDYDKKVEFFLIKLLGYLYISQFER